MKGTCQGSCNGMGLSTMTRVQGRSNQKKEHDTTKETADEPWEATSEDPDDVETARHADARSDGERENT